jgi:hypothetical protein
MLLPLLLVVSSCASGEEVLVAEAATVSTTTMAPSTTTTVAPSTTTTVPPVEPGDCTVSSTLEVGAEGDEVLCLERHLGAQGWFAGTPDTVFDDQTRIAVRNLQANSTLIVDGIAGRQTAELLGLWMPPPVPEPDPATCSDILHGAVIDREFQRSWLCTEGEISHVFPITTAWDQPDPGDYEVEQKDMEASSILTGEYSEMTHFVVFTYGKYQGARVGFHSVPTYPGGEFIQSLESVGTAELRGESNGCIRVLPDDAELIWDHLDFGDTVRVIS